MKWFNKEIKSKIIIRSCVGCIIPNNAILIGKGTYIRLDKGKKIDEPYYDYEIEEDFLDNFIDQNYIQLIKYSLIDEEKVEKTDDKNPVKETTLRGYAREVKNN